MQTNCSNDDRYERKTAANGKGVFQSEGNQWTSDWHKPMYASEASRDKGIVSVKENGTSTTIKDNV